MIKKTLILLVIGLFVFSGCTDKKEETYNFSSADGNFKLTVDSSILPAGTGKEDIKISAVQPDDSMALNGQNPIAVYKLEPSGLKFSQPVSVQLAVTADGGKVPALYHISDDGFEVIESVESVIKEGEALIKTKISHFSTIVVYAEVFNTTINHPSLVFVGQTFDVTGNIGITNQQFTINWKNNDISSIDADINDPWSVEDKLMADDASPVTPIVHQEPRQNVSGNTHTYTKQFTCTNPGSIRMRYNPSINWTESHQYTGNINVPGGGATVDIPVFKANHVVTAESSLFDCTNYYFMMDYESLEDVMAGETLMAEVIVMDNHYYPVSQFEAGESEECGGPVYHAEGAVYSLDGETLIDTDPAGCGFGLQSDLPVYTLKVSPAVMEGFEGDM